MEALTLSSCPAWVWQYPCAVPPLDPGDPLAPGTNAAAGPPLAQRTGAAARAGAAAAAGPCRGAPGPTAEEGNALYGPGHCNLAPAAQPSPASCCWWDGRACGTARGNTSAGSLWYSRGPLNPAPLAQGLANTALPRPLTLTLENCPPPASVPCSPPVRESVQPKLRRGRAGPRDGGGGAARPLGPGSGPPGVAHRYLLCGPDRSESPRTTHPCCTACHAHEHMHTRSPPVALAGGGAQDWTEATRAQSPVASRPLAGIRLCSLRAGAVQLAAVGVAVSVFNLVSKVLNFPLLNITTSFVAAEQEAKAVQAASDPSGQEPKCASNPASRARSACGRLATKRLGAHFCDHMVPCACPAL